MDRKFDRSNMSGCLLAVLNLYSKENRKEKVIMEVEGVKQKTNIFLRLNFTYNIVIES